MNSGHFLKSFSVFSIPLKIMWMACMRPASAGQAIRGPSGVEWSLLCAFWNFFLNFLILIDQVVALPEASNGKALLEFAFGMPFATEIAFVPYFLLCLIAVTVPSFLFFRDKSDRLAAASSLIVAVSVVSAPVALYALISGEHLEAYTSSDMSLLTAWAQHASQIDMQFIFVICASAWVYSNLASNALQGVSRGAKALYFITACATVKLIEFPALAASIFVLLTTAALSQ